MIPILLIGIIEFASIDACLLAISDIPVDAGDPPHNFPALQHVFHHYIPFKYSFRSAIRDMIFRNRYNNHCASYLYISFIHEKSATDVHKSYSITLPRWTLRFVSGLFLAALGYSKYEKGRFKGRQANDPSALLSGPNDSEALNSHIDRQDHVAMPLVHYQSAM